MTLPDTGSPTVKFPRFEVTFTWLTIPVNVMTVARHWVANAQGMANPIVAAKMNLRVINSSSSWQDCAATLLRNQDFVETIIILWILRFLGCILVEEPSSLVLLPTPGGGVCSV